MFGWKYIIMKLERFLVINIIPNLNILIILRVLTILATLSNLKYWAVLLTSPTESVWFYNFSKLKKSFDLIR